jgi:DNA-binding response OmpR family regulator
MFSSAEFTAMRVLLADDDIRIGKHVRQALSAEGYAVDYAQDGDEAFWWQKTTATTPSYWM